MIKRDDYGLIVQHDPFDKNYGDGGDSSRSTGMMAAFGSGKDKELIYLHYLPNGLCIRHPNQFPWNNPSNFSRDQLIPLLAGMAASKDDVFIKNIFVSHAKRFFFCQNFDLTNPAVIGQMILGGKIYWLYPFLIVSYLWHFLELFYVCELNPFDECNQIMAQCKQFKTEFLFKKFHPNWRQTVHEYWSHYPFRDQTEVADQIVNNF